METAARRLTRQPPRQRSPKLYLSPGTRAPNLCFVFVLILSGQGALPTERVRSLRPRD